MRKRICRYRKYKDLQIFAKKIGKNLDNTVKEVNMVTGEIKYIVLKLVFMSLKL